MNLIKKANQKITWAEENYNEFIRNFSLLILSSCVDISHERALWVVYRDFGSSFEELLRRGSSTTFHQRNLQKLVTEVFKVKTGIA